MRYIFDNDLHLHSYISACSSDPEQTTELILEYAKKNSLKRVCLTDHYWDSAVDGPSDWYRPQNYEHVIKSKPLPTAEGIEFLFGVETDMDKFMRIGIPKERFSDFDFVVIPTTHFHMPGFTVWKNITLEERARMWVAKLDALFNMDLPFRKIGIAHLACDLIAPTRKKYNKVLSRISDSDLVRIFTKAAELGVGIELNREDMDYLPQSRDSYRIFTTAKKCGCKFYMASDAHHPEDFENAKAVFERAIDILELTEDDKFYIG